MKDRQTPVVGRSGRMETDGNGHRGGDGNGRLVAMGAFTRTSIDLSSFFILF